MTKKTDTRTKFTYAVVTAVLLLSPAWAHGTEYHVTAMEYNIGSAAGIPLGLDEIAQIAQEIKTAQADIVGMTEVDIGTDWHDYRDMVAELNQALIDINYAMEYYHVPIEFYHEGTMVQVLWSRYPIVSTGYQGTAYHRKINRITVQIDTDVFVHGFMTHYAIGIPSYVSHQQQTDAVIDYTLSFGGPRIVMGDFNFESSFSYYDQIIEAGLKDSCVESGSADCLTVGSAGGVTAPEPRLHQIDFIFGSQQVNFTNTYVPSTTVSDHWPIVAEFTIPPLPAIGCSQSELSASVLVGNDADPQTFAISNSGVDSLNYSITSDANWVSVTPDSGQATLETDIIAVDYSTANLVPDTYYATISIFDENASNSPRTIDVTLVVIAPAIDCWPQGLTTVVSQGYNPSPQSFNIANSGGGPLNYSITTDAPWVSVDPDIGQATDEVDSITVNYSTAAMVPDIYFATISIADAIATNSPQTIDVTLTIITPKDFDFNTDDDIDQEDFGRLQVCLSGRGQPYQVGCENFDIDDDNDIDQSDLSQFLNCMSGPNVSIDMGCLQESM